jgi:c-di-GMP-binding flagellar brake protein YcgR
MKESPISRRAYERLDVKVKISYKLVEKGIKPVEELVQFNSTETDLEQFSGARDISAGGIFFFSDKLLPPGSILELKMELPDGVDMPLRCLIRVERTEEIMVDKIYGIAVCFLDMPSAERVRIDRYIKNVMGE